MKFAEVTFSLAKFSSKYLSLIKYLTGVLAFVYIYYKINESIASHTFASFSFAGLSSTQCIYLALSVVLMLVNWGVESYKWQNLMNTIERVSFVQSVKATFLGISIGMFTPNRIGEFGGRVLYISPENRMKAGLHTMMGSFSQLIVTMIIGGLSFVAILYDKNNLSALSTLALFFVAIVSSLVLISIYYNYRFLWNYLKHTFLHTLIKRLKIKLTLLPKEVLNQSLFLSLLRYV
ncbi:MAG: flippase-like domain-containing protein, partial [Bacteroidetes bacterium]|nr:flippase-like domain-containing protein [Bacteroidota bacterium]